MQEAVKKQNAVALLITFMVWPFGGLLYCIKFLRERIALNYIIAFFALYGYSLVYSLDMDAHRYVLRFQKMKDLPWAEIEATGYELYFNTIAFILSRFTDNSRLLFALLGLVYGYFFIQAAWILIQQLPEKLNLMINYFFAAFLLFIPIASLIGVRSHTAMFVFLYACLLVATSQERKWWHLILATLSITIHWSYIIPVAFFWIFYFGRSAIFKAHILIAVSFLVRYVIPLDVSGFIELIGGDIEGKYTAYTVDSYVDGRVEALTAVKTYVTLRGDIMFVFLFAVWLLHFLYRKKLPINYITERMYVLFALMVSMFNFLAGNIISYDRFQQVTNIVGLAYVFFFIKDCATPRMKQLVFFGSIIPFAINFWVNTRLTLDSINAFLLLGNGFYIWLTDFNQSILNLLGIT